MARILLSKGDYKDTLAMCMKLKKGLKSKLKLQSLLLRSVLTEIVSISLYEARPQDYCQRLQHQKILPDA